ncbi:Cytochrome P450 monooxygenase FUS8 [Colletotrichum sp. SAR 10_70]|nr:Cytochrome P450 monooxygenase FUS8 [Colletotrichum sp. SAR 10_71]KAI8184173.1 Cytochrome P450 monooxygenase FUS8 [Colletotrichum sp. SAR 10_75]KAI8197586.1 Cytochrome P450 monooxygenase FUS8 [Colletotrichum sp. SAR 10_70]KAI8207632.1 Cytochrome P450 monooxygenase FUS8 [Colletotrichum sp. SAR 10_65]KAI8208931.1 Cytochrome P450 monooxygenase FUS8 [Colletotrichum sp. SAR 10_76]KAI8225069.1 Cytochrome P450 monooxygenase FUS8 [Colletotrichum sp. SAR 10_86]
MLGRPGLDIKTAATVFGLLALVYYGIEFLKAVWVGLTGPLSKVPGPWLNRFTAVPWKLKVITGKSGQMCIDYPKKYGEIVRIAPNVVMISNKEAVHQIVVEKDLRKSAAYEKFRQDKDIATIFTIRDRAEYRTRRRLLSHGFSVSYIKGLEPMMLSCIRDLEEVIDERCAAAAGGKAEIDIWHLFGCLTSDVMSETSFGGSFKLVKNGEHPIRLRMSQNFRRNAVSQDPELKRLVDEVIARRRTSQDKIAKPDILQLLLDTHDQNPENFSDKVVMAEMFLFMLAGGETAATTLIFAFIFLLDDPVRYERLVDEVRQVFPDASSPVTNEMAANLPFLNAVLKETLRLRAPAASGLQRQTDEDIVLAGHLFPAGTAITANTFPLHLDDREWADAEDFVPERWLSDYKGVPAAEKMSYYPFSAASRNCIGKQFAWNELRLTMASLLRRYDFFFVPGQSRETMVLVSLQLKSNKYLIGVKPRA